MKKLLLILVVILFLILYLKRSEELFYTSTFFSMGTYVTVTLPNKNANEVELIANMMHEYAKILTNDSYAVSTSNEFIEISKITYDLLKKAEQYNSYSSDFKVSIATVSKLYGFPEGPFSLPSTDELDNAIDKMKSRTILLETVDDRYYVKGNGLSIDLGSFAKGFIVDEASKMLLEKGIVNFIINAGGDIYSSGRKNGEKWRFGIVDPDDNNGFLDIVMLENMALATSGNYERYFVQDGEYVNHIFSAKTGKSVNNYRSVSVVAKTAEEADVMATIYYLMPLEEIAEKCSVFNNYVLILSHNNAIIKLCD